VFGDATKRTIDVLAAVTGLLLLSRVFLIVSLLVTTDLGRPVLFAQPRPGKDGKPFRVYRLRKMRDIVGADGGQLPDSGRFTKPGRLLRSSKLDELPELVNVFGGHMSLVGPRPLLPHHLYP